MGIVTLLTSLWPFLKEMFIGEKIKDTAPSKKDGSPTVRLARWCINKMQTSRRFLTVILLLLVASLFFNYKLITKITAIMPPRDEKSAPGNHSPTKEPKEPATIPRQDTSEKDVLLEQTVRELKILYGATP